jgi:hypothetical protein
LGEADDEEKISRKKATHEQNIEQHHGNFRKRSGAQETTVVGSGLLPG